MQYRNGIELLRTPCVLGKGTHGRTSWDSRAVWAGNFRGKDKCKGPGAGVHLVHLKVLWSSREEFIK